MRDRLLFAYGFKDTEPWPQFAQSLQIPREGTGAFWMIMGNNMELTGRDWSAAWLRPPSLGFEIYAMQARGDEKAEDVTLEALEKFVDGFLAQVRTGPDPDPNPSPLTLTLTTDPDPNPNPTPNPHQVAERCISASSLRPCRRTSSASPRRRRSWVGLQGWG